MLYPDLRAVGNRLPWIDTATLVVGPVIPRVLNVPAATWGGTPVPLLGALLAWLALAFLVISRRLRIYHVRRTETLRAECVALLEASLLASAVACLVIEVFLGGLPGGVYLTVTVSGIALLLGTRTVVRVLLRRIRTRGQDPRRWLLVGRNQRSAEIAREALANPHYGIRISAVVDARQNGQIGSADPGSAFRTDPLSALVQYEDLRSEFLSELITREAIDEVVIALPLRGFYDEISAVMVLCAEAGIPVKTPTRAFECVTDQRDVVHLGDIPLATHYSGPVRTLSMSIKRGLDVVVASTGLILTAPACALIAMLIKLTSRGPLFFSQTRVGLHNRSFTMLKFRTMHDGASERQVEFQSMANTDGPAFKMMRDPRITPVGRFLRKHHLDELPQLWNVLRGDMSLVGPRPLPPDEANGSTWWQRRRLSMQPGMTCLWQVRADHRMPFEEWMRLDLHYIDQWSLWLDVRVLAATVVTVVQGRGW